MASFAGMTIEVQGNQAIPRSYTLAASVRHIPGGDRSYLDIGGRPATQFTLPLVFRGSASVESLQAMIGQAGQLSYSAGTFQALLLDVTPAFRYLNGTQMATAEFLIL